MLTAAVLLGLGLCLAWQILAQGLSAHLERRRPALALSLSSHNPGALARIAEVKLGESDIAGAERFAKRALAQSPLEVRALRVLGLSRAAAPEGRELLAFAGERTWRDGPTHAWLMQEALRRGDTGGALTHADALLRRPSRAQGPVFQLMSIAVGAPDWAEAIGESVSQNPPWRTDFLVYMARRAESDEGVARVFHVVEARSSPLTRTEIASYLNRHFAARRPAKAHAALVALGRLDATGPLVFDGGFDQAIGLEPFAWTQQERIGVALDRREAPVGGTGTALRVEYDGYSSTYLLRQMTVLPPGEYAVSARTFAEHGPGRLRWRLECMRDGRWLTELNEPMEATAGAWRTIIASFRVPEENCEAQWLMLVGLPGDHRTTIVGWYDDIGIRRASGPMRLKAKASSSLGKESRG